MSYIQIKEAPVLKFLFNNTKTAFFWLLVRLYVGWEWLVAGWDKVNNPAWVGDNAGAPLTGFIKGALTKTGGAHPDVQMWYAQFLQDTVLTNVEIWSKLVAYGELLVGIALIVGLLTGVAAFFGLFMNINFLMAGTVSTNPILFTLSLLLIMAWRVAGYLGLDRWFLPEVGTPWRLGKLFRRR